MLKEIDKNTITSTSKIMIPTYLFSAWWTGIFYIFDQANKNHDNPFLKFAVMIMDIHWWGVLFIIIAASLTIMLFSQKRILFVFFLYTYGGILAIWAGMFFASALFDTSDVYALYTTAIWPLMGAIATFATARSLMKGETTNGSVSID